MVFLSCLTRFTLKWASDHKFWILPAFNFILCPWQIIYSLCSLQVSCVNNGNWPIFSALVLLVKCSRDAKCSALLPQMDCYLSLGFIHPGFFFLPRGCGHQRWTAAGSGGGRGDVSGEGRFRGERERKLGWTVAACSCGAFAQVPLWQAAGEAGPAWTGRGEGLSLYPSKCSAWSHSASQRNLPGVKRKKRETERGQETKGGIKSKNVPWSFSQQNAEKVISNFFHLGDEATK